jgi:Tol biopolymer transport system component
LTRVSTDGQDSAAVWSPDGRQLAYTSRSKDGRHIVTQPLDGSDPPASLVASRNNLWPAAWTPDGERLIYVDDPPTSLMDIKSIRRAPVGPPDNVVASPSVENQPDLSPDGRWIAFVGWESGRPQIFIRPLDGGTPRQITPDGGGQPRWSRDGREIFLRRLGVMMRIAVQTTPALVVGKPERLFDDPFLGSGGGPRNYDVSADGQRFLLIRPADTEKISPPIHLVTGWFEELTRRVPVSQR